MSTICGSYIQKSLIYIKKYKIPFKHLWLNRVYLSVAAKCLLCLVYGQHQLISKLLCGDIVFTWLIWVERSLFFIHLTSSKRKCIIRNQSNGGVIINSHKEIASYSKTEELTTNTGLVLGCWQCVV